METLIPLSCGHLVLAFFLSLVCALIVAKVYEKVFDEPKYDDIERILNDDDDWI